MAKTAAQILANMPYQELDNTVSDIIETIIAGGGAGGLTEEQKAGLLIQPIYSEAYPVPGAYPLPAGYDPTQGWLLCQFVCTTEPSANTNQYPISLHSGSTTHTRGIRIFNDQATAPTFAPHIQPYERVNSATKSTEKTPYALGANAIHTAMFVWRADGYQFFICDGYFGESTQTNARVPGVNAMQISGRNGGTDPLVGTVINVEIGNQYLTPAQAKARMLAIARPIIIATAGQSNIQNWKDGVETLNPSGHKGFKASLAAYTGANCPGEIILVHGAEGGSSIFKEINETEYWWDNGQPGPELTQFYASCDAIGDPDFIIWDQGESECHSLDSFGSGYRPTAAEYEARLLLVLTHMKNKYPLTRILFSKLGIRTTYSNGANRGIGKIRDIQQKLANTYSWMDFGMERYDLALAADGVHYLDASYTTHGARGGRQVARLLGYEVPGGTRGPRLGTGSRVTTTITQNIVHDKGTDFTPSGANQIAGFQYFKADGTEIAVTSALRASATTVTITLASDPGGAGTLYYIYDNPLITDLTTILKDNGANTLPLQTGSVAIA